MRATFLVEKFMPTGIYKRIKPVWNKGLRGVQTPWNKGKKWDKKAKIKMSNSHKGKKLSEETCKKMSESARGRVVSTTTRKKISISKLGKFNPNWKGGVWRDKHDSRTYRSWTSVVFKRDNFTCCLCRQVGRKLNAHHIKPWAKFPKLRYKIDNGITLCECCHKIIHLKKL